MVAVYAAYVYALLSPRLHRAAVDAGLIAGYGVVVAVLVYYLASRARRLGGGEEVASTPVG